MTGWQNIPFLCLKTTTTSVVGCWLGLLTVHFQPSQKMLLLFKKNRSTSRYDQKVVLLYFVFIFIVQKSACQSKSRDDINLFGGFLSVKGLTSPLEPFIVISTPKFRHPLNPRLPLTTLKVKKRSFLIGVLSLFEQLQRGVSIKLEGIILKLKILVANKLKNRYHFQISLKNSSRWISWK